MTTPFLLTLGSILLSRVAHGVPVPEPQAAITTPVATVPAGATSASTLSDSAISSAASGSSAASATLASSSAPSVSLSLASAAAASAPSDTSSTATGTTPPASPSETSESVISQLNGLSTGQLAMYVGIGLGALVALGIAWYFFRQYQKKKKANPDDDSHEKDARRSKRSKYDSDDDLSNDESEDEPPTRSHEASIRRQKDVHEIPRHAGPPPGIPLPPDPRAQQQRQQSAFYPEQVAATFNLAGAGAQGDGYGMGIRHNTAMDVYPVATSQAPVYPPTRPVRAEVPDQQPRQMPVHRTQPPARVEDDDSSEYSSDDSDSEAEEEKKRRIRREAKKKARQI